MNMDFLLGTFQSPHADVLGWLVLNDLPTGKKAGMWQGWLGREGQGWAMPYPTSRPISPFLLLFHLFLNFSVVPNPLKCSGTFLVI